MFCECLPRGRSGMDSEGVIGAVDWGLRCLQNKKSFCRRFISVLELLISPEEGRGVSEEGWEARSNLHFVSPSGCTCCTATWCLNCGLADAKTFTSLTDSQGGRGHSRWGAVYWHTKANLRHGRRCSWMEEWDSTPEELIYRLPLSWCQQCPGSYSSNNNECTSRSSVSGGFVLEVQTKLETDAVSKISSERCTRTLS